MLAPLLEQLIGLGKQTAAEKAGANLCKLLTPPPAVAAASPDATLGAEQLAAATASAQAAATGAAGARLALLACCATFGGGVFTRLPSVWNAMHHPLTVAVPPAAEAEAAAEEEARKRRVVAMRSALNLPCVLAPALGRGGGAPRPLIPICSPRSPPPPPAPTSQRWEEASASASASAAAAADVGIAPSVRTCDRHVLRRPRVRRDRAGP